MRIAFVHDFLVALGGAERVLLALHAQFPEAPIFTLFADPRMVRQFFPRAHIRTSWLQRVPSVLHARRLVAPLAPAAIESFDLSEFDVVISSSVNFAKGVITRPTTKHICYCYSPSRPLWDRAHEYEYAGAWRRHLARIWDSEAAERVDTFVAISEHVRARITKYYRRDSQVIFPPMVHLPTPAPRRPQEAPYVLSVGRLVPHKNYELLIDTFAKLGRTLVVVGDGPLRRHLQRQASPRIRFTGFIDDARLATYLAHAEALVVPCEEDFGLTPLEAMQFGVPVLALRKGAVPEIVQEGITGEFFDDPIPEGLADGLRRLERHTSGYDRGVIRATTQRFSRERFTQSITALLS